MIYLDKSSVIEKYPNQVAPTEIGHALELITKALEKTTIYYKGNRRTPPSALMLWAETRIKHNLSGLSNGVAVNLICRDKQIKTIFPFINSNDRVDILIVLDWNNSK